MMKRMDRNQDGKVDETEKEQAKEMLQEKFGGQNNSEGNGNSNSNRGFNPPGPMGGRGAGADFKRGNGGRKESEETAQQQE